MTKLIRKGPELQRIRIGLTDSVHSSKLSLYRPEVRYPVYPTISRKNGTEERCIPAAVMYHMGG